MTDTTIADAPAPADKRDAVAKHEMIAAPGGEHVAITEAAGIRYTDRKSGQVFEYIIPGVTPGSAAAMLAIFGAKTKATNEASRVRNGLKGSVDEEFEAIDEVFTNITNGVWREKAEGGGGSRTDKGLLAIVLVEMLGERAQGTAVEYQNRLETEDGYLRKVLSNDAIKAEYRKRAGKTGPTIDALV